MINLRIRDGELVYWTFGAPTLFTNTSLPPGTFPNDPSTFAARYGNPPRQQDHPEVRANFLVDAETLTGAMSAALSRAAADPSNPWGLTPGPNVAGEGYGYPTSLEQHDFAATQMPHGWLNSSLKLKYHDLFVGTVGTIPTHTTSTPTPTSGDPSMSNPSQLEIDRLKAKLNLIGNELDDFDNEIPETGRGKYAEAGRKLIASLRNILSTTLIVALSISSLLLTGCAANWRALIPGGVSAADAEWTGVKTSEVVGVAPTVAGVLTSDPRTSVVASTLSALGADVGVIMTLNVVGETSPRLVLCIREFESRCRAIPVNAQVHFAGRVSGLLWHPSRLTFDN